MLAYTAEAGDSTITLTIAVDWEVGDYIGIASTGARSRQKENEKKQIAAITVNGDGQSVITLTVSWFLFSCLYCSTMINSQICINNII